MSAHAREFVRANRARRHTETELETQLALAQEELIESRRRIAQLEHDYTFLAARLAAASCGNGALSFHY